MDYELLILIWLASFAMPLCSQTRFAMVELNCENLFDCQHDSLYDDYEYCEGGARNWHPGRYWRKLNNTARTIIACGGSDEAWRMPDLAALVEVENDSVMFMLSKRSLLNRVHYDYVMTRSDDPRGVDVALLYNPKTFRLTAHYSIRPQLRGHRTRDILYVKGMMNLGLGDSPGNNDVQGTNDARGNDDARGSNDVPTTNESLETHDALSALHVFVVHAPSRRSGKLPTEEYRMAVTSRLCQSIDSLLTVDPQSYIIVAGDFNDYSNDKSVLLITQHGMVNVSADAKGLNGAQGTYRFQGEWGSLDQMLVSKSFLSLWSSALCYINDADFLTEDDDKYGGRRPHRTYNGYKYDPDGFSDHLPLVLKLIQP